MEHLTIFFDDPLNLLHVLSTCSKLIPRDEGPRGVRAGRPQKVAAAQAGLVRPTDVTEKADELRGTGPTQAGWC